MNAIFYKEWIKTRWYLLLALLVTLGFAGYSMLRINRVASMKGVEHVWEVMLARDTVFVDLLEFIPLLVGILLADRKSTRLNSSHTDSSRMPSSA